MLFGFRCGKFRAATMGLGQLDSVASETFSGPAQFNGALPSEKLVEVSVIGSE